MTEITIRVWDDNDKELVHKDAMEFKTEGERLGSKNVLYVPKSQLQKAEKERDEYKNLNIKATGQRVPPQRCAFCDNYKQAYFKIKKERDEAIEVVTNWVYSDYRFYDVNKSKSKEFLSGLKGGGD